MDYVVKFTASSPPHRAAWDRDHVGRTDGDAYDRGIGARVLGEGLTPRRIGLMWPYLDIDLINNGRGASQVTDIDLKCNTRLLSAGDFENIHYPNVFDDNVWSFQVPQRAFRNIGRFMGSIGSAAGDGERPLRTLALADATAPSDNPESDRRSEKTESSPIEPERVIGEALFGALPSIFGIISGVVFLFVIGVMPTETKGDQRKREKYYRAKNKITPRPPNADQTSSNRIISHPIAASAARKNAVGTVARASLFAMLALVSSNPCSRRRVAKSYHQG
jgi:hypothetical protein